MKLLFLVALLFCYIHLPAFEAKALDKDWTFDPKTSSLIPKYLGSIKALKGKAIIGERDLKKGSKIYNNDLVQTSLNSFAVIELIDLTIITLGPSSDFKVENWSYRTKNDRNALFSVIKGQWRALIKSKSKEDDQLKIKTSLVSMGVRGTEVMVNVNQADNKEMTQVALLEGHIHLKGEQSDVEQDLNPGDHALFVKDQKGFLHQERKLSPDEIESYKETIAPDILRLLTPEELTQEKEVKSSSQSQSEKKNEDLADNNASRVPHKRKRSGRSIKENLKKLNSLWAEELKK